MRILIFNMSCKTTFYVVSLCYGEQTIGSVPLFFCPDALKKGARMRKILSELVKKVTELVKICSVKIIICSDLLLPTSAKKLFSSESVKSARLLIALKMKRGRTSVM